MRSSISQWLVALLGLIVLGIFLLVCFAGVATGLIFAFNDYKADKTRYELSKPLEPEVVQDICLNFNLPSSDRRCQPDKVVYAYDLLETIFVGLSTTTDQGRLTYDQVDLKTGKYRYDCEPTTTLSDGTQYFRCEYDLQGDRLWRIIISFDQNKQVKRIFP